MKHIGTRVKNSRSSERLMLY